jgi:hypothetical protein
MVSEMLVDWLKHAFITKFNHIRPSVYERYTDVLCRDLASMTAVGRHRARKVSSLPEPFRPTSHWWLAFLCRPITPCGAATRLPFPSSSSRRHSNRIPVYEPITEFARGSPQVDITFSVKRG